MGFPNMRILAVAGIVALCLVLIYFFFSASPHPQSVKSDKELFRDAVDSKSADACYKMSESEMRAVCISTIDDIHNYEDSVASLDLSACDSISNDEARQACISVIWQNVQDE